MPFLVLILIFMSLSIATICKFVAGLGNTPFPINVAKYEAKSLDKYALSHSSSTSSASKRTIFAFLLPLSFNFFYNINYGISKYYIYALSSFFISFFNFCYLCVHFYFPLFVHYCDKISDVIICSVFQISIGVYLAI